MKERAISVIFGLAIFNLSFLMAIATANLPDLDPADDILAENILPSPADLIESESHEMEIPRESPALVCYDLPVPQVEVREVREGESSTFYSLGILNYADYPPELFNRPCSEGRCRVTVALIAEDGSTIYGLPIMFPDMFGDHFDFWYEGQIETAYFAIIDESCDRSVRSSLIHFSRPSPREDGEEEGTAAPTPGERRLPDAAVCYSGLPTPQLIFTGWEDYSTADGQFTRYNLAVTNRAAYPVELLQAAPDLPPCGSNSNSARSRVNIYDGSGNYLYGFCALSSPADLEDLWFAVRRGETPPRSVYITIEDRKCGNTYRSNAVSINGIPGTPGSSLSAPVQLSPADGSTFGHYPRSTTLRWSPVEGAATYTVEIDCYNCCVTDRWCTDMGRVWSIVPGISSTNYTFDFVGKQPGRWMVWAVKANGEEGPKSGWWTFEYTT